VIFSELRTREITTMPFLSKTEQFAAWMRQQITEGTWPVGYQLPPRRELQAEHHLSNRIVQKALKKLVDDGWLISRPRIGYFVPDRPLPKE
jgi:DNA-binding GntR family transcriptional regulator